MKVDLIIEIMKRSLRKALKLLLRFPADAFILTPNVLPDRICGTLMNKSVHFRKLYPYQRTRTSYVLPKTGNDYMKLIGSEFTNSSSGTLVELLRGDTSIFRKAQVGKDNEQSMRKRSDRRIAIFQVGYPVTFLALYMQCGVPFIAFDYPGYRHLATKEGCGVVIRSLQELPEAAHKILVSHEEFRRHAYQAFCKHYDFARSFAQVIEGRGCAALIEG